jgi:two-component system response regulator
MHQNEQRPWELLIVDDNPGDSELLRIALGQWQSRICIHVVEDGDQALQYVRREGRFTEAQPPDLIVLDLHLPGRDGIEILNEIRGDHRLRNTPVVMMSTSDSRRDIERAYSSHVNSYITKTADADAFMGLIQALDHYWFHAVQLPSDDRLR